MARAIAANLIAAAFRAASCTKLTTLPRSTASPDSKPRPSSSSTATTARNSTLQLNVSRVAASSPRNSRQARLAASASGARRDAYPGFIEFCHPTLSEHAPSGEEWAHEIEADGYRAQ